MTTPTTVWCIRHGETDWNAEGRWQGHAPVPLNETGLAQAAALKHYLAAKNVRFDALYSSPASRAMQTAQAVAEAAQLEIQPEARLREVDLGEWQGLTRSEACAWDGKRFAEFEADRYNVPPPGGETRLQLMIRAREAFDAITARHSGAYVALVTHGGTLGMLIESLLGKIKRPTLSNTSITILVGNGDEWQLERIAWAPHLETPAIGETW